MSRCADAGCGASTNAKSESEGKPPIAKVQNEPPDMTVEAGGCPFSSNIADDVVGVGASRFSCLVFVRRPCRLAAIIPGSKTTVAKGLSQGFLIQFIESSS